MICPNADGSESPTYTEHADSAGLEAYCEYADQAGLDYRLRVMAHREARGQYLRILEEIDAGIEVTQPMTRAEVWARRGQGWYMWCAGPQCVTSHEKSIAIWRQRYGRRKYLETKVRVRK